MIVFSAKISEKHQNRLKTNFPEQKFVFCKNSEEAKNYVKDAVIYVTFGSDINESFLKEAKRLKWIQVLSAGVDELPFEILQEKDIILTNVRGIHAIQMAEYAISMLMQVYRQGKKIIKNEENQIWDKSVRINEITGKTMVVAGTGAIGSEVARLGKAFRMHTIGISKSGRQVEFFDENYNIDELNNVLSNADFVISVLPSTPETQNYFTLEQFRAMANHAVFLNMGRGNAVVEEDLLTAVQQKEIAHAVLDVVKEEPLPKNHPFWTEENITITPHISGLSPSYMKRALKIFEDNLNIDITRNDNYINLINLSRGY
ncbi:D-2-hydroxyacid dehydrogenase [Oceanobacillus halophilus]|uniref:D-2-hydroxyacid dehydrogenase n=1 Tax=Oceanobacillus halophilus TaxID=930130 RepID=A0A494ZY67_9BACI|nr:D-2-hydroxyacid dehydrogenase [Oceanobacillus halophilus]RKQ31425.1 D-2-hydroxyacid dehydrogenase [Oceanobacillus halophilus]